MGVLEKATCKVCGRSWRYKTGCGVNHWDLKVVLEMFSDEVKAQVNEWASGKDMPLFQFDYHRAVCGKCKAVVGVPVLKLFPENTQYVVDCENCGGKVSVSEETKSLGCPECGGEPLEVCKEGLWD